MPVPIISEIPKDSDTFLLWFGIGAFGLIVSTFGWIAKRVYPTWVKNKLELEQYKADAMAEAVTQMSSMVDKHLARFDEHMGADERNFRLVQDALHSLNSGQQRLLELQIQASSGTSPIIEELRREIQDLRAEHRRLQRYHESDSI